jgi:uncharacterized membrane protein
VVRESGKEQLKKVEKHSTRAGYTNAVFCAGIALFFLYRVVVEGQATWELLYACYLAFLALILQIVVLQYQRRTKDTKSDQLRKKLRGVRAWTPLIAYSAVALLLVWPVMYCPTPPEPWIVCLSFFALFCVGAIIQFVWFAMLGKSE